MSLLTLLLLIHPDVYALESVGKVVLSKGQVTRIGVDGKTSSLKEGTKLFAGDLVQSEPQSSLKAVLSDQSELNLGPDSKIKIEEFEKGKPSLVSVVNGQLRAKVSKSSTGDVKMLFKTKASVMGVRGTDFQVIFNEQTQMTSLVMFEGQVSMAKAEALNPVQLLAVVSDPSRSVTVHEGQFSASSPSQEKPTLPVKISPSQLESLKVATLTGDAPVTGARGNETEKKMISPVPPGVSAKLFSGSMDDVKAAMMKTMGEEGAKAMFESRATGPRVDAPPPEGMFNAAKGEMAPPAGGFVDLKTGVYVPPPPGSAFDPVAGVYIPPPNMGSFRADTGSYVPPAGFVLDATRGFVSTSPGGVSPGQSPAMNSGGVMFAGMRPEMFGSMTAPPPPPGTQPGMMGGVFPGAPGMNPMGGPMMPGPYAGGPLPGFPNFMDGQPQYPVYNPSLCPPLCDPVNQTGTLPPPPSTAATTSVTFTFN